MRKSIHTEHGRHRPARKRGENLATGSLLFFLNVFEYCSLLREGAGGGRGGPAGKHSCVRGETQLCKRGNTVVFGI